MAFAMAFLMAAPAGGSAVDPALQQKGEGMDHTTGAGAWQGDHGKDLCGRSRSCRDNVVIMSHV